MSILLLFSLVFASIEKINEHWRWCFIDYPNTLNFKNTPLKVIFSTLFLIFGYPDETMSLVFELLLEIACHGITPHILLASLLQNPWLMGQTRTQENRNVCLIATYWQNNNTQKYLYYIMACFNTLRANVKFNFFFDTKNVSR